MRAGLTEWRTAGLRPCAVGTWPELRVEAGCCATSRRNAGFSRMRPRPAPRPPAPASPRVCSFYSFCRLIFACCSAYVTSIRRLAPSFFILSPSFSRLAQAKLDLLVIGSNSWKRGCALPCMGQRPFVWGQGSRRIVWLQVPGCRWAKGGTGRAGLAGTGSGVPSERQGHSRGRLLQRVYNYLLTGFPVLSDLRAGLHFHHSFRQYQAQSEDSVGARFVSGRFYHRIS